ncbi:MAG: outer membrane lipoprotein LolB [Burkholderiales bacterium]|nr:MAG: outer membrane lipoprotein LolB [Betaproteobacteria bacterium]TAG84337.1 MAG: outer membrane lipoprotein LolB [Burkholderiales bacterium]
MSAARLRINWFLLLGAILGLTGCATVPMPGVTSHSEASAITAANAPVRLNEFSVAGRFSARRGDQSGTGQFRYSVDARATTLDLFTPTGAQLARIERVAGGRVVGVFGDGSRREAENFAELLRGFIEISISDAQFFSWLQGIPADGRTPTVVDSNSNVESFSESGWSVVISARFDEGARFVRRMRWAFDAAGPAEATEIRWVFDEFSTK